MTVPQVAADSSRTRDAVQVSQVSARRVVPLAAVALVMTGPGQTATISVFVEPVGHSLGLGASQTSMAYMIGTLTGAATMPLWGRMIDRFGTRRLILVLGGSSPREWCIGSA